MIAKGSDTRIASRCDVDRRTFLAGALGGGLCAVTSRPAGAATSTPSEDPAASLRRFAVWVPGYEPDAASAEGVPLIRNRTLARGIRDPRAPYRLMTRVGLDGTIRQALLPAAAHDVEVAPDRSVAVLCGFEAPSQVAFDPESLDVLSVAPCSAPDGRGGGHAVWLDGGRVVALTERAPRRPLGSGPEAQFGRVSFRDPKTLKVLEVRSSGGIDPHDVRAVDDGRHLVIAHYGSLPRPGRRDLAVPRDVVEASIVVLETATGKVVDKWVTGRAHDELRHLAAGRRDRIFGIQARLVPPSTVEPALRKETVGYGRDMTADRDAGYGAAATLRVTGPGTVEPMGTTDQIAEMRHGLSIVYDPVADQAIATYPTAHRVMVFDGATGRVVVDLDTRGLGLRHPAGIALLPDGRHYVVTGWWENLFVFERATHRLVRDACLYPVFFGHSHIAVA